MTKPSNYVPTLGTIRVKMQHYPRKLYARDEMQIALDEIDKLRDSLDLAQKMHITGTDRLNAAYAKAEQLEAKLAKFHEVVRVAKSIFPEGSPIVDGRNTIEIHKTEWYAMREALGELES
jgi:hypothetical protein